MPNVTFDGQSFSVKGRRIWLAGAEFEYALTPAASWRDRLAGLKRIGCNAVIASCPWSMHEPRPGRLQFDGDLDLRAFATACAEQELWLILRIGPAVGGTFDGAGLPAWLADVPEIRLREQNAPFLGRVIQWYRALADRVERLQTNEPVPLRGGKTRDPLVRQVGPILAVQIEDDWASWSSQHATGYLGELTRYALEVGFDVPILTNNHSWTPSERAIDIWTGWDDLAPAMRQLAHIEPAKPRIAVLRAPASRRIAGERAAHPVAELARDALRRLGIILAGGGQFFLTDAGPTVHAGATSGSVTLGDGPHGPLASVAREGFLFDYEGATIEAGASLRRIIAFASSFGHVLSQADSARQVVVIDPESSPLPSIVPLDGPAGTVLFVFAPPKTSHATLLLADGRRLEVALGAGPLSWFLLGADLAGAGRLDYATVTPFAFLERRQVVFFGPAGTEAVISLGGVPLSMRVPSKGAARPAIETHEGLTVVLCNEEQVDRALLTPEGLLIGATRVDEEGRATRAPGVKSVLRIALDGRVTTIPHAAPPSARPVALSAWSFASCGEFIEGSSPRFATLDGPASLAACGAREGYGWYRLRFRGAAAETIALHAPMLADRSLGWLDGRSIGAFGNALAGGAAKRLPLPLKLARGEQCLTLLVEALGRPVAGDHTGRRSGAFGPFYRVKPLRTKPKREEGPTTDPFRMRGFIYGVGEGDVGAGVALVWRLDPRKRTALLFDPGPAPLAGTLLLNGAPIARVGEDGLEDGSILLEADRIAEGKPGAAELRYVFDLEPEERAVANVAKHAQLFEAAPAFKSEEWAFARWAVPANWSADTPRPTSGPLWARATFDWSDAPQALRLDVTALGRGRAFLNKHPIGRYVARDERGRAIGGRVELPIPATHLVEGRNELLLFEETGAAPKGAVLRSVSTSSDARSS